MEVLAKHNIGVPVSKMASTAEEAESLCKEIMSIKGFSGAGTDVVIKAQVLSGGRGLGHFSNGFKGGVHMCFQPSDAKNYAKHMLGSRLITKQSGPAGMPCDKVLLMERVYMRREMYLSIMMDRHYKGPVIVACASGGTSIEDLAEHSPELVLKEPVDIKSGLSEAQAVKVAKHLQLIPGTKAYENGLTLLKNLYDAFIKKDCTLIEINPLAETPDGRVLACDAKLNFDDNASYRQKEIFLLRDYSQEDSREVEAAKFDLNYIGLSGNIGCMVNGAGLAMATMDIIKLKGGDPANFLDVGGGATESQVQKALELLDADKKVSTIMINIFGGIMRCDVIATGVVNAVKNVGLKKPIVIRLQGTNVAQAKKIIAESGFKMIMTDNLDDAATKAVAVACIAEEAHEAGVDVAFQAA
jgi:succinyl-CoA synthetase beta subunit